MKRQSDPIQILFVLAAIVAAGWADERAPEFEDAAVAARAIAEEAERLGVRKTGESGQSVAFGAGNCSSWGCQANKGVMFARLQIPEVPFPVDVLNTHMQSGENADEHRETP